MTRDNLDCTLLTTGQAFYHDREGLEPFNGRYRQLQHCGSTSYVSEQSPMASRFWS